MNSKSNQNQTYHQVKQNGIIVKRILHTLILMLLIILLVSCSNQTTDHRVFAASADIGAVKPIVDSLAKNSGQTTQAAEKKQWLIILYQDADDEVLEEDIVIDFNEAEISGPSEQVTVIVQIDRHKGGRFRGDGGWTTTKRFELKKDADLNHIRSKEIVDLGELDSGDYKTLVDFATWAIKTYPADKVALVLSDHGGGWTGGWTDDDPNPGSSFTTNDIDNSLREIIANTSIKQFEFVGFDACLMSQIEALTAIIPYAKYAAASEEVEPGLGWAWADILEKVNAKPQMNGAELGKAVVDGYILKDMRIVDDKARRAMLDEDAETKGLEISAEDYAAELLKGVTMTAVDLAALKEAIPTFNQFAEALTQIDADAIAKTRTFAQAYYNVINPDDPSPYIDLVNFINVLKENTEQTKVKEAGDKVIAALKKATIAEKHGEEVPGSNGFTIYFPVSSTFELTMPGMNTSYTAYASRFATASMWNEFLVEYFTGIKMDITKADLTVLEQNNSYVAETTDEDKIAYEEIKTPGTGKITISPLQLSKKKIRLGESINIKTNISGTNIGNIFIYTMYFDNDSKSYLTTDIDYVIADLSHIVNGVIYPNWDMENGSLPFEVDWEANIYFLSDGKKENDQFALFEPQWYGIIPENNHYRVHGNFTLTDKKETYPAALDFSGDGALSHLWVSTGEENSDVSDYGPEIGDTFTVTEQWLDLSQNSPDGELIERPGGSITFGKKPLRGVPYEAVPGEYIIGVVVKDYNDNITGEWAKDIVVTE